MRFFLLMGTQWTVLRMECSFQFSLPRPGVLGVFGVPTCAGGRGAEKKDGHIGFPTRKLSPKLPQVPISGSEVPKGGVSTGFSVCDPSIHPSAHLGIGAAGARPQSEPRSFCSHLHGVQGAEPSFWLKFDGFPWYMGHTTYHLSKPVEAIYF